MTLNTTLATRTSTAPPEAVLHSTAPSHHRFHLLDALRGIAAFLVVLFHMPPFLCNFGQQSAYLAVDFFFCLSGFVIAFSYEKRLLASMSLKDFFAARAIRLYPTYLLATLLGFCVFITSLHHPLTTLLKGQLLALTVCQVGMLPNLHIWPGPFLFPMDEPAWSLFYEFLANLAFAALLRKKHASSWTMILSALLGSALLSVWAFKGHRLDVGWSNDWHHITMGIARVTLSFSTGVLMLRLFHRTGRPLLTPILQRVIPITLAIALIFLLTAPIRTLQTSGFQVFTILVLFPAVVYLGSLITTPASWTKLCVFLGNISYPVYLLQGVLFALLYKQGVTDFAKRHPHAVLASFLALLTALSHLTFKLYDAPVRSRLTHWYNTRIRTPKAIALLNS